MQIVNKTTLAITTLAQLRKTTTANIPKAPSLEQLAKFNHAPLEVEESPAGDKVTRLGVAELRDGRYYPTFQVESFTVAEKTALIEAAIQQRLDAQAQAMGYESIATAVTYADEPAVAAFQQDGQALRAWRSQTWAAAYQLQADYSAAVAIDPATPEPTLTEVLAALPVFA